MRRIKAPKNTILPPLINIVPKMFHLNNYKGGGIVPMDISKTTKFKPSKKLQEQLAKVGTILIGNPNLCKDLLDTQLHMCGSGLNEPFQLFLELANALIKIVKHCNKIITAKNKMTTFLYFLGIYIWKKFFFFKHNIIFHGQDDLLCILCSEKTVQNTYSLWTL